MVSVFLYWENVLAIIVTQVNDMIQLMVRKPLADLNNLPDKKGDSKKEEKVEVKEEKVKVAKVAESKVYKVGDGIDVRDRETGGKEY